MRHLGLDGLGIAFRDCDYARGTDSNRLDRHQLSHAHAGTGVLVEVVSSRKQPHWYRLEQLRVDGIQYIGDVFVPLCDVGSLSSYQVRP